MSNLNDMDICPLLTGNTIVEVDGKASVGTQPCYCLKEGCSWWVEDKQKENNSVTNLEWVTDAENKEHARKLKRGEIIA